VTGVLVALIGQPNSGKSALLARLTGARVVTSNYPGTTVEVLRGTIRDRAGDITVLDTPGTYSLAASSKEQEVARDVIVTVRPALIVNVVDATNLARHLALTLELLTYRIPMVLALNSCDLLHSRGISVDTGALSGVLGVPVFLTSALTGEGVEELKGAIVGARRGRQAGAATGGEQASEQVPGPACREVSGSGGSLRDGAPGRPTGWKGYWPRDAVDLRPYQEEAERIAQRVVSRAGGTVTGDRMRRRAPRARGPWARAPGAGPLGERIERLLDVPALSIPVLILVLVVAWKTITKAIPLAEAAVRVALGPVSEGLTGFLRAFLPPGRISEVLAEAVPEGIVLPLATVLPAIIVAYTFIALLEDSGLLGRYAALGDALTGLLRLPGQALIPFVLAFGCRVPAILSARILPSDRSRWMTSIIVGTVIPCTATVSLGLAVLARFGGSPVAAGAAIAVSIAVIARLLGSASGVVRDPLVLELPPLRFPIVRNVLLKTGMRLTGFFDHVLPLVVAMNVVLRLLVSADGLPGPGNGFSHVSGLAARVIEGGLGIPPAAFGAVLLTMFQRYLAPLFLLQLQLTGRQATIAVTMVALGLPCLPSSVALWREMGPGTVVLSFLISAAISAGWGVILNLVLP
jgi:ferrous iron transport protein B